ncbi:MAG: hypothetical protein IPM57_12315 [Oligoflexia bacterium]|nr:hypothetical protein [Oligoflexia bacterium]
MIKFLFLNSVFLLIPFLAFAQIPQEAFKLNPKNEFLEFIPADDHHFNDKAPNKVELNLDGQTKKLKVLVLINIKLK